MVKEIKEQTANIMGGPGGDKGPIPDQTVKHVDHGDPPPDGSAASTELHPRFVDKGDPGLESSTASTILARPVGPQNPGDPGPDGNNKPTATDGFKLSGSLGAGAGGDPGLNEIYTPVTMKPGAHGGPVYTPKKQPKGDGGTDIPLKDPVDPIDPDGPDPDPEPDERLQTALDREASQLKGGLRAVQGVGNLQRE